jgi:hypothetical protein
MNELKRERRRRQRASGRIRTHCTQSQLLPPLRNEALARTHNWPWKSPSALYLVWRQWRGYGGSEQQAHRSIIGWPSRKVTMSE